MADLFTTAPMKPATTAANPYGSGGWAGPIQNAPVNQGGMAPAGAAYAPAAGIGSISDLGITGLNANTAGAFTPQVRTLANPNAPLAQMGGGSGGLTNFAGALVSGAPYGWGEMGVAGGIPAGTPAPNANGVMVAGPSPTTDLSALNNWVGQNMWLASAQGGTM